MKALLTFLLCLFTPFLSATEAPSAADALLKTLLTGIVDNDLSIYHKACDQEMQASTNAEALDELNILLSEAMLMGYEPQYLGALAKTGKTVHLWRLNFTIKGIPDMLAELSIEKEKASKLDIR